jgi:DNA repair protein RadC
MQIKLTDKQKQKVQSADDVYGIMQRILMRQNKIDRKKEHFWTIGLDNQNNILYIELISLGGSTQTIVEPMQVFRVGVLKGAIKLILVHNHPSGTLKPSEPDQDITDRLIQVGKIIQIEITDHLIISEKSYLSLHDAGILNQIKESKKYKPTYKQQEEFRKDAEAIGKAKGRLERDKEIASQMKAKGYSVEEIVELTGLPVKVVKVLK